MRSTTIEDAYSHDRTPPMLTENPGRRQEGSQDVASSCPGLKQQDAASDGKVHAESNRNCRLSGSYYGPENCGHDESINVLSTLVQQPLQTREINLTAFHTLDRLLLCVKANVQQ